ncbi:MULTISPECIES: ABC transporter permease subunit [Rhodopseudomonas]|uniref:Glutamate/aspartate import permease protein GltK n=1 Tax=Rhodopseudomonas palustris TaxID=1076 RepID=A0A0D7ER92_RHOPL|nr:MULTISPECIES: ABC transporter permease subunit [Rhodopseudomonas]KIZ41972.1 amino acid ABC transporter permease [Rhodopseudomonas palustris]MDF3810329.1 ABC transporter permease subunit [Rhodopseudomonas sp. BAL398]WOK16594.1 ABC transporter permease subunit [Rhodopseudomonas sp. BAL398]
MLSGFDLQTIVNALPYLIFTGMRFTLALTACATLLGIVIGTVLAIMRLSRFPILSGFAAIYVNLLRSLPLVLVIFWFYFLVPFVVQWLLGSPRPVRIDPFWSSVVTFTLFEAAYFCEIVRSGIQSLPTGQTMAAHALGLTGAQTMAYVVLPQALRNMLPLLLTQTIILFQDTSLVYVLSITDFLGAAARIAQRDGRLLEMYLFAAAVYFVISILASFAVRRLQKRVAIIN